MSDKIFNELEFKTAMKDIIHLAVPYARAVRAYYNALIEQGFTEAQALQIAINHGYMPPTPRIGDK